MRCFHPVDAWQRVDGGPLIFGAEPRDCRPVTISCGRCIGCREKRAAAWAHRIMHESSMHRVSSFATFTYDEEHYAPSLNYSDFQAMMYRLRKRVGNVRFFCVGEYGEINARPHFHAILFGHHFADGPQIGNDLYQSSVLSSVWRNGFVSVGAVTRNSAAYCARYSLKKVTGDVADSFYTRVDLRTGEFVRVEPEFARMSLKPGIGYTWFQRYWRDLYLARDGVPLPGGFVSSSPRYYDKLLEQLDPDLLEDKQWSRFVSGQRFIEESSPDRLAVQETCVKARLKLKRRSL